MVWRLRVYDSSRGWCMVLCRMAFPGRPRFLWTGWVAHPTNWNGDNRTEPSSSRDSPSMASDDPLLRYYAQRAPEFERVYEKPERDGELQKMREYIETAFAGANVLEVACGTGYWTEVLSRS